MKRRPVTLSRVFQDDLQDPDFLRESERLKPYYDLVVELIKRRGQLGLTQEELAARAGTHQARISKIESGELDFRFSTLVSIANALGARLHIALKPQEIETHENTYGDFSTIFAVSGELSPASLTSDIEVNEVAVYRKWKWATGVRAVDIEISPIKSATQMLGAKLDSEGLKELREGFVQV